MKILRLIPVFLGVAVLLFGIYLVSTNGYVAGTYLPSLIGMKPCTPTSQGSNFTPNSCAFNPYGAYGVGTIVCIFGLGLIATSARRVFASSGSTATSVSPEVLAALAQANARTPTTLPPVAPGARPGTVYCSNCGAANPTGAKFCHQCASPVVASPPLFPPTPGK